MEKHVTQAQVEQYLAGALRGEESVRVADHLFECEQCREFGRDTAAERLVAVRSFIPGDEHIGAERIVSAAGGGALAPEEARHLDSCAICRRELSDLRAFSGTPSRTWQWRWAAAAAAVAVVATGLATWRHSQRPEVAPPAPVPPVATVPAAPPPAVTIADASGTFRLMSDGSLEGPVPDLRWRELVSDALQRGITVASLPSTLAPPAGRIRGETDEAPAVTLESPVAVAVEEPRPLLSWSVPPGANSQVKVFDLRNRKVAESDVAAQTEWRLPIALQRGELYSWQVSIHSEDGIESVYPRPPAPPARFLVITEEQANDIAAARRSGSHLVAAIAYARAGMRAEAKDELAVLQRLNPASPQVAKLLSSR